MSIDSTAGSATPVRVSGIKRFFKSFLLLRESPVGMIGFALVFFWVLVALGADFLAPYNPLAQFTKEIRPGGVSESGLVHLLGTDVIGRDILSRLIHGARRVLFFSIAATLCAYAVGIPMGLAAGYFKGRTDEVLSFTGNVILSFPPMVLFILLITLLGQTSVNILIAVTLGAGPGIMRIVRSLTLDIATREYIFAAQTRGEPSWRIMFIEILPNARGPLIVDFCLRVGYVIIIIGILGFLGLGLPPPDPDWGGMINEGRQRALQFPHITLIPCIAVSSLVLGFNFMADGLREISLRD